MKKRPCCFLLFSLGAKLSMTAAQLFFGLFSGSLSLIADGMHNLTDAGSIIIALITQRIAGKKPNNWMTYGYQRAEILGILINSTVLITIGFTLVFTATKRLFSGSELIDAELVLWVALFAFCLDAVSAFFSYIAGAKNNLNIKAVFLHNLADTLTSLAVIVSAIVMLIWHINGVDVIATLFISGFIIFQGFNLLKKSIKIIMQATPAEVDLERSTGY